MFENVLEVFFPFLKYFMQSKHPLKWDISMEPLISPLFAFAFSLSI
jgi:hypothetical protein